MPTKLPDWYRHWRAYDNTEKYKGSSLQTKVQTTIKKLEDHNKHLDKRMNSPEYKDFKKFLEANRGELLKRRVTAKAGAGYGWIKKQFIRYGAKQFLKKDN